MIFIDRSLPGSVAEALKQVRDDVIWLEDRFPHDTPDNDWLAVAGQEGWLVISRDKRISHRQGERAAIAKHNAGCFILGQRKPPTRWECLKLLARTLDKMEEHFAATSRPFIYIVNSSGQMRRVP